MDCVSGSVFEERRRYGRRIRRRERRNEAHVPIGSLVYLRRTWKRGENSRAREIVSRVTNRVRYEVVLGEVLILPLLVGVRFRRDYFTEQVYFREGRFPVPDCNFRDWAFVFVDRGGVVDRERESDDREQIDAVGVRDDYYSDWFVHGDYVREREHAVFILERQFYTDD